MRKTILALLALLPVAAFADVIVLDSFDAGSTFTLSNSNGTASYNYISGQSSILGGSRQIRVRAAGSGFYGPSTITNNTTDGTIASWGTDASERVFQYGTAIGSNSFTGAGPGVPVDLNLNLNLSDSFQFDVAQIPTVDATSTYISVQLFTNNGIYNYGTPLITSTGTVNVLLSQFSGLTEQWADDINGIDVNFLSKSTTVGDALVISEARIVTSAIPEPSTYAALAGAAVLGLAAVRRRRKAA